jgi:hypothetical protein
MSENLKILAKLAKIMQDVDFIKKDAKNLHGKYNYASEFAIKVRLHDALTEHGVLFQLNAQVPITVAGVNGQFLPVEYTFWDTESGESISGNFVGSAHIRDEKGHYAAITGAIKYILTSMFLIPTGDDPERDEKPKNVPVMTSGTVSNKQWDYVTKLMQTKDVPTDLADAVNSWAARSDQTEAQASEYIERLKACPTSPKDEKTVIITRIKAGEPKVYPLKKAIDAARVKYLGKIELEECDTDALKAYLEHIVEKYREGKAA